MFLMPVGNWSPVVPMSERIRDAKRDAHARRFFNKDYTSSNDLLGAISFWVGCRMPVNSLNDFLAAIEPPNGWPDEHQTNPNTRPAMSYGQDFSDLMRGYWGKWKP